MEELGYKSFGLDLSAYLLSQARINGCRVLRSDMRQLPFLDKQFSLVCSFFSSFGYFKSREEDLETLGEMVRICRTNGYLYLDLMHGDQVKKSLPAENTLELEGMMVKQSRYLKEGLVCKDILIKKTSGEEEKYQEQVRIYGRDEFISLLSRLECRVIDIFGSEEGGAFNSDSLRMSFLVQRIN